jgi:hypothetical protein
MIKEFDILLGADDDLITANGDLVIGECFTQEVGALVRLNQGELKSDPLLGPSLLRMINSNANQQEVQTLLKLHLERDGKNYDDVKGIIQLNTKTNE